MQNVKNVRNRRFCNLEIIIFVEFSFYTTNYLDIQPNNTIDNFQLFFNKKKCNCN